MLKKKIDMVDPKLPDSPNVYRDESLSFSAEMDRSAICAAVRSLSPEERVSFWSSFEPTADVLFPSIATGEPADDLAAVLAGSKPATILLEEELLDPLVGTLADTLTDEEFDSIPASMAVDGFGGEKFFIGTQQSVDALEQLYTGRGTEELPADENFHRGVGEALGYPTWAIDEFIAKGRS